MDYPKYVPWDVTTWEYSQKYRRKIKNWVCENCGDKGRKCKLTVHHRDLNKQNCDIGNLQVLCQKCHTELHQEIDKTNKEKSYFEKVVE